MRVVIDLASVQDTARIMLAAADQYDLVAAALQRHDGTEGVTGRERYWLFSAMETAASRLRALADRHRQLANDLYRRASVASSDRVSPVYAGLAVAAGPAIGDGGIRLDRDGDGTFDAIAYDQDGDGRYETFVADSDLDGSFDTIFTTDAQGELNAAAFDADGDGFNEGFVGVTAGGVVRLHDADRDGYHERVAWDRPQSYAAGSAIVSTATPGFRVAVDPNARAQSLTLSYPPSARQPAVLTASHTGSLVVVDPNARATPLSVAVTTEGSRLAGPSLMVTTPVRDTSGLVAFGPVRAGSGVGIAVNTTMTAELAAAQNAAILSEDNSVGALLLAAGYGPTNPSFDDHLSGRPYDQPSVTEIIMFGDDR